MCPRDTRSHGPRNSDACPKPHIERWSRRTVCCAVKGGAGLTIPTIGAVDDKSDIPVARNLAPEIGYVPLYRGRVGRRDLKIDFEIVNAESVDRIFYDQRLFVLTNVNCSRVVHP